MLDLSKIGHRIKLCRTITEIKIPDINRELEEKNIVLNKTTFSTWENGKVKKIPYKSLEALYLIFKKRLYSLTYSWFMLGKGLPPLNYDADLEEDLLPYLIAESLNKHDTNNTYYVKQISDNGFEPYLPFLAKIIIKTSIISKQINRLTYLELSDKCLVGELISQQGKFYLDSLSKEKIEIIESNINFVGDIIWTKLL